MSKFDLALPQTWGGWFRQLWLRYHFKFVVPRIEIAVLDGIQLDVSSFSLIVRNRIVNGYEEAERKLCREYLSPSDVVLEIGGGIGFISLFCKKIIGIERYFVVEANPMTIEVLKRNYRLNGSVPQVRNVALAAREELVELNVGGDFWGHFINPLLKSQRTNVIRVPGMPLLQILAGTDPAVNVLIIDVEGGEQFIDFARLPDRINKLIIELHPCHIGKKGVSDIISTLASAGFRVEQRHEDSFALIRNPR
jgi:FkbM family methyltransferase